MPDLSSIVAFSVNGQDVSLNNVLYSMKVKNNTMFITDAINESLIKQTIRDKGIHVDDMDLQEAADQFRQSRGLHKVEDTDAWLDRHRMTIEDLEYRLESMIAMQKLRDIIADHNAVERYFANNRLKFDAVDISQIVVENEGIADELKTQIDEEEADFYSLARKYSVDKRSNKSSGYLGIVSRKSLSLEVESVVFNANDGDIVGPIHTDQGYHIIKIEKILRGSLSDGIKETIKTILFDEWLSKTKENADIDIKLLDMV